MPRQGTTTRLRKRIGEFVLQDTAGMARSRRALVHLLRFSLHVIRELRRDRCPEKAASLAFTTVLSLVPVLLLFVLYFKVAGTLDALSGLAQTWIVKVFVADAARDIVVHLDRLVSGIHVRTLGMYGILGLVVTAHFLFRVVEGVANDVWKLPSRRSFWTRFQILSTALLVIPAFLFASLYVSGKIQHLRLAGAYAHSTTFTSLLHLAAPFLLTLAAFFLFIKLLPNTRVRWKPALLASIVASVLFESAKSGFNYYVIHVVSLSALYGSLGLLPVFLLWIYFSWLIALLGTEVAFTIQNLGSLHEEFLARAERNPFSVAVHEEWGLKILAALARRFRSGEGPAELGSLAREVDLLPMHVSDHLRLLWGAGIAAKVESERATYYSMARPHEQLTAQQVKNVFRRQLGLEPLEGSDPIL